MKYCFELEEYRVGYIEVEADSEEEAYDFAAEDSCYADWDTKQFDTYLIGTEG